MWSCREVQAVGVSAAKGTVFGGSTLPGKEQVHPLRVTVETKHQACGWYSYQLASWLHALASMSGWGPWAQTLQITSYPQPPLPRREVNFWVCPESTKAHLWKLHPLVFAARQIWEPQGLLNHIISTASSSTQGGELQAGSESTEIYLQELHFTGCLLSGGTEGLESRPYESQGFHSLLLPRRPAGHGL
jgi:hypothetical protein